MNIDSNRPPRSAATERDISQPGAGEAVSTQQIRLCSHCKQAPARPGQRYCRACHREATRVYRVGNPAEYKLFTRVSRFLAIEDIATRRAFEQKFGRTRRVAIEYKRGTKPIPAVVWILGSVPVVWYWLLIKGEGRG